MKILKKNFRKIILTLVGLIIVLFLMFSDFGIVKRIELLKETSVLVNQIRDEKNTSDSLKNEMSRLYNDYSEIERIAREYYGYVKPGEKIYIILDERK